MKHSGAWKTFFPLSLWAMAPPFWVIWDIRWTFSRRISVSKFSEKIRVFPNGWMVAGWWQLKYVFFSPRKLGKISNLTSIFCQMGWFNHQNRWEFLWCLDFGEILRHSRPPIWACYGGSVQPSKNTETPQVIQLQGVSDSRCLVENTSVCFPTSTWGTNCK